MRTNLGPPTTPLQWPSPKGQQQKDAGFLSQPMRSEQPSASSQETHAADVFVSWAVWQKIILCLLGVASLLCPLANIINISRSGEIDFPFYSFGSLTGSACQGRVRVTITLCYELVYQLMSLFGHSNLNVFSPSPAGSLFQLNVMRE